MARRPMVDRPDDETTRSDCLAGWLADWLVGSEVLAADAANHRDKTVHGSCCAVKFGGVRTSECASPKLRRVEKALMHAEAPVCIVVPLTVHVDISKNYYYSDERESG